MGVVSAIQGSGLKISGNNPRLEPAPRRLSSLEPQQRTVLSSRAAQVCMSPADMAWVRGEGLRVQGLVIRVRFQGFGVRVHGLGFTGLLMIPSRSFLSVLASRGLPSVLERRQLSKNIRFTDCIEAERDLYYYQHGRHVCTPAEAVCSKDHGHKGK